MSIKEYNGAEDLANYNASKESNQEVWIVNKNINWEREIVGVYTSKEQAELHASNYPLNNAYITHHKLNENKIGTLL